MNAAIYALEIAGPGAFDVFTKEGRFAGLLVTKADGTVRHRYNDTGSKGSAKKFPSLAAALENIHTRRMKRLAK